MSLGMRRWVARFATLVGFAALLGLTGCLDDRELSSEGDACRSTAECDPGLICVGLECTSPPITTRAGRNDAGFADSTPQPGRDVPTADLPPGVDSEVPEDTRVPGEDVARPDVPGMLICNPRERDCQDNSTVRICTDDGLRYATRRCADGTICQQGQCVEQLTCEDRDGDGVPTGQGCPGQVDCNDSNPTVFPGAAEVCDGLDNNCNNQVDETLSRSCRTQCGFGVEECIGGAWSVCSSGTPSPEQCNNGLDDDCDGRVDEGCAQCCEPDSCSGDTICVECECREAPRDECLFQNQPCDPFQAGENGEYFCVDFAGGDNGFCLGLCSFRVDNPDATCPTDDAVCAFMLDDNQGLCLDQCDPSTGTGCFEGQGCIALQGSGGCVPSGDIPEQEECEAIDDPFNQCEPGTVCLEVDQFGGSCQRLCNPTSGLDGEPSACRNESACLPFGDGFGLCIQSLEQETGSTCRRAEIGAACNDRAFCDRGRGGEAPSCRQLCRFDGNDCPGNTRCRGSDIIQDQELGLCR